MAPRTRNHNQGRRRRSGHPAAVSFLVAFTVEALAKIVLALLEHLLRLPPRRLP